MRWDYSIRASFPCEVAVLGPEQLRGVVEGPVIEGSVAAFAIRADRDS